MKMGNPGSEKEMPRPERVSIEYIEISRKNRTASAKLVKDIIAIKQIFTISYKGLTTNNINMFLQIYQARKAVNFIYDDAGKVKSTMVYLTNFPRELFIPKPQYSKNITITLEEV